MGLKRYKLGDLIEVTRGQSLAGEFYAEEGKYIRLTLGNFDYANGGFKPNTSKTNLYYTGPIKEQFILEEGDIITPLTEQTPGLLGSTARIPISGTYIQSQDVALVRCKDGMIDPAFCYYLLPSSSVKKQLAAGAQQTKIRHTSPDKIKDVVVDIPDISEQRRIGQLLDAITHKIELNRSINQNLEALAKQLYDYWFVQFDFPDENGRPYKSSGGVMAWSDELRREIPAGWNVVQLGSLIESNRGISYNTSTISGGGVPMLNLASFNVDGTYKHKGLKSYNGEYSADKVLKPFDLVMCNTQQTAIDEAKDIIGKAFLVPNIFDGDIVSSHHVTTLKCESILKPYLAYLSNTRHFHKYATGCCSGTNIMGLDFSGIERYRMELPPKSLIQRFYNITIAVEEEKCKAILENERLISLRDELLPLLMNGQVSLNSDLSHD